MVGSFVMPGRNISGSLPASLEVNGHGTSHSPGPQSMNAMSDKVAQVVHEWNSGGTAFYIIVLITYKAVYHLYHHFNVLYAREK